MDDITPQQAKTRFQNLPEIIRQTISDPATYASIEKIALIHKLTRVEAGLLAQATSMLMMGFLEPNQYIAAIMDQLSLSREDAAFIAQEINRDIFNPIKDALKEVHAMDKVGGVRQVASPTERPLGTAPIVPSAPILPNLSVLPSYAAGASVPQVKAITTEPVLVGELRAPVAPPKPLPTFSMAQALGNIPSTGSSQNTEATSVVRTAPIGTTVATASTGESGNILEDKLGGTYRMRTETTSSVGVSSPQSSPTQVVPPPPQATTVPPVPQEKSALAKALDPYRETPL